jgi:hypothetical protein
MNLGVLANGAIGFGAVDTSFAPFGTSKAAQNAGPTAAQRVASTAFARTATRPTNAPAPARATAARAGYASQLLAPATVQSMPARGPVMPGSPVVVGPASTVPVAAPLAPAAASSDPSSSSPAAASSPSSTAAGAPAAAASAAASSSETLLYVGGGVAAVLAGVGLYLALR